MEMSDDVDGSESELYHLTSPEMRILYYVLGAALRKTLDTIESVDVRVGLEGLICMKETDAVSAGLPCETVIQRQKYKLLIANNDFYEAFRVLEEETLKPMCVNMRKLALLGKCFKQYFECQLSTSLAYEIVRSLFDEAIQKLGVDVCCNELSYRLIRYYYYYVGTTFNDFVANQFRNMKHDVEMDRNLSKRLKILTNVKIVSSVTEKDHLSQVAGQCSGAGLEVEGT